MWWFVVIQPFSLQRFLYAVDNMDSPMQVESIDDPTVHELSIKDLDRRSHYRFHLRGRTAAGQGLPITKVGATTLDGGTILCFL